MADLDLMRMGALTRFVLPIDAPVPAPNGTLTLCELAVPGQINLRGNPSDPLFLEAAAGALGTTLPLTPNTLNTNEALRVVWLGPDEWLILTAPGDEAALIGTLGEKLSGQHAAVTDVSGNRALIRLSGEMATEVLAKGCSIDLHPKVFVPGSCAQTLLGLSGILLIKVDDTPTYDILPRRSFGEYTWMWLSDAMSEFGGTNVSG